MDIICIWPSKVDIGNSYYSAWWQINYLEKNKENQSKKAILGGYKTNRMLKVQDLLVTEAIQGETTVFTELAITEGFPEYLLPGVAPDYMYWTVQSI